MNKSYDSSVPQTSAMAALLYHDGTKHPGGRLLDPHHRYLPGMDPPLEKMYHGLAQIALPALKEDPAPGSTLTMARIAYLLHYSAGVTKRITYPSWGTIPFRAAACTGALYHIELYLVCEDLPGLPAGVYHYEPLENTLTLLRSGEYRSSLVTAAALPGTAQAYVVYTDVPFRNAVKYQARAYRHAFWDCGTILANSLALAADAHIAASLFLGFADEPINILLGLDGQNEFALALLALGQDAVPSPTSVRTDPLEYPLDTPYRPTRGLDVIQDIHHATSLDADQVPAWRLASNETLLPAGSPAAELLQLPAAGTPAWLPSLAKIIKRRGSSRRFTHQPIPFSALAELLAAAGQPIQADFLGAGTPALTQAHLVVNAVEDLPAGGYRYNAHRHALELLRLGENRPLAGYLALGQSLAADAAVCIYFLAPLTPLLERFVGRGYRAAQMEAAIRAGRIYLQAYNLGLGATGLTFYDDEVIQFFSPAAAGQSVMFLVAAGMPFARRGSRS